MIGKSHATFESQAHDALILWLFLDNGQMPKVGTPLERARRVFRNQTFRPTSPIFFSPPHRPNHASTPRPPEARSVQNGSKRSKYGKKEAELGAPLACRQLMNNGSMRWLNVIA
jgi:hypothetical protein